MIKVLPQAEKKDLLIYLPIQKSKKGIEQRCSIARQKKSYQRVLQIGTKKIAVLEILLLRIKLS